MPTRTAAALESSVVRRRPVEIRTLLVALTLYGGFFGLTWCFTALPLWFAAPSIALLLAWYGSLQHETIHGHPTGSRTLNTLIGGIPLSLWLPYGVYRDTHLRHHRYAGRHLTDPLRDPESFYLPAGTLARLRGLKAWAYSVNRTLAGRLVVGPALTLCRSFSSELPLIRSGARHRRGIWLGHLLWITLVLVWVVGICRIPAPVYLLLIVYPSISLGLLRSFAEHRAADNPRERTAVVDAHAFWSLLFLNNNLHVAHHAHPRVPWYELPRVWREMCGAYGGAVLQYPGGYREILRRFLFRPVIAAEHPSVGAP